MLRPVAGRVLRLLLALALVPVGLLTVAACKPCPPGVKADLRTEQRAEDVDLGDLLKQSEEDKKRADPVGKKPGQAEPNGGVNAKGNGGPPAGGCPPAVGKAGSKVDKNMFGANGAQTISTKLIKRFRLSKDYTFRLDVENKQPGKIPGNIHVQAGGEGSTQYYWRGGTTFTSDKFEQLPKVARDYIAKNEAYVEKRINHGLRLLGEKE